MRQYLRLALMVSIGLAAVPAVAYAQASFAGSVRDTSGGVLPGVTVEAASPALIEQVRSVVTDGTGQYRIENLRPGTYTLTFTLPGFSVVSHEGLELTGTFTATVNAEMQVGALEETITVTGESPVVDVQSTTRQTVLDAEIIDAIPTGRSPYMLAATLPGVTRSRLDIGGTNGDGAARGNQTTRGNTDTRVIVGGLGLHSATGQTSGVVTALNIGAYQEVAVDTGGIGAENAEGGVIVNLIPPRRRQHVQRAALRQLREQRNAGGQLHPGSTGQRAGHAQLGPEAVGVQSGHRRADPARSALVPLVGAPRRFVPERSDVLQQERR